MIERLERELQATPLAEECRSLVACRGDLLLCRPQTFMNRSGWSLRCLAERHQIGASAILVLYDEVALPLGRLRARPGGGPGGHRGMESVIENLRTEEISRVRLGVGPIDPESSPMDLSEYVLSPFAPSERESVEELVERAVAAARLWLEADIGTVMNRFNG